MQNVHPDMATKGEGMDKKEQMQVYGKSKAR